MATQLDHGLHANRLSAPAFAGTFELVELRRYTMKPGKRDVLIDIFEREFIETQEASGMLPIGHFRDLDDPDAYVWFRGFERAENRAAATHAFYTSETWLHNREAANATMIDTDDVHLLRNARPDSGFDLRGLHRPPLGARNSGGSLIAVSVSVAPFDGPVPEDFVREFEAKTLPSLAGLERKVAYFVTDGRPNDYPRLPIRTDYAFVAAGVCASARDLEAWTHAFSRSTAWKTSLLEPASRSLLR